MRDVAVCLAQSQCHYRPDLAYTLMTLIDEASDMDLATRIKFATCRQFMYWRILDGDARQQADTWLKQWRQQPFAQVVHAVAQELQLDKAPAETAIISTTPMNPQ